MPAQTNNIVHVPDLRFGLDSRSRPEDVAKGFGAKAECAWLYRSLEKAHGYERVSHRRPWEAPLLFDVEGQRLVSPTTVGSGVWNLPPSGAFEFGMRPITVGGLRWIIGRVTSEDIYRLGAQAFDTSKIDWAWWLDERDLVLRHSGGEARVTGVIEPGKTYHVSFNITVPAGGINVYEIDLSDPDNVTATLVGSTTISGNLGFGTAGKWVVVGSVRAQNDIDLSTAFGVAEDHEPAAQFHGAIQDIRIWSAPLADPAALATTQLQGNESNLSAYWTLTDRSPRRHLDAVTSQPLVEVGDASWDGNELWFYGLGSYVRVPNPSRFRKQARTDEGKIQDLDAWCVALSVKVDDLQPGTVFHWVHAQPQTTAGVNNDALGRGVFDGAWTTIDAEAIMQLTVEQDPVNLDWTFRATWWGWDHENNTYVARSKRGPSINAGTEYRILIGKIKNAGAGSIELSFYVDGTFYGFTESTWKDSNGRLFESPSADDDPPGSIKQEAMVIGRSIGRAHKAFSDATNPDDVILYFRGGTSLYGRVRRVAVLSEGPSAELDQRLQDFPWDKDAPGRMDTVLAAWPMDEGVGDSLADLAGSVESIPFEENPEILRGQPCKKSLAYGKVHAIVDHRYRDSSGPVRKVLVVHDGGLSELVDKTQGVLLPPGSVGQNIVYRPFVEGFRNDTGDTVSVARFKDTLILCVPDSPPMHLWRDALWRFSVKPLRRPPPHGLVKQSDKEGGQITRGLRKYVFTLYNAHADKESAPSSPIAVEILSEKANVAFGEGVEVHQRPASSGIGTEEEPWDFTSNGKEWLKVAAWNTDKKVSPTAASGKKAKWYVLKFTSTSGTKKDWIDEVDGVLAEEVAGKFPKKIKKANLVVHSEGRLEIRSDIVGSKAGLAVGQGGSAASKLGLTTGDYFGIGVVWRSGLVGRVDPQATHVRIYRSQLESNDYHLVAEVPIAQRTYEDSLPDGGNISELANLFAVPIPPEVGKVVAHGSRLWFFGETRRPWLVWPSDPVRPEITQVQDLLSLTAGRTLEIVGAIQTQDTLVFGKRDSLIGVYESSSSQLPAIVRERSSDVGLVSAFGSVSVDDIAFFASERGVFLFDGSAPRYVSGIIQPSWLQIDMEHAHKIHAAHYRKAEVVFWTVPTGETLVNGNVANDRIVALFYGAGAQGGGMVGWSLWPGCYFKSLWVIPDDDEEERVWAIDELDFVYRLDVGNDFGIGSSAPGATTSGVFAADQGSASIVRVVKSSVAEMVHGWEGLPITVVKKDLSQYATRYIVKDLQNNDPTVIYLDRDLPWTPQRDDLYFIGGIPFRWESGDMALFGEPIQGRAFDLHVDMTPKSPTGQFYVGYSAKRGLQTDRQLKFWTVGNDKDELELPLEARGRRVRVVFFSPDGNVPVEIGSYTIFGRAEQRASRRAVL